MTSGENLEVYLAETVLNTDLLGHYDKSNPVFHYTSPDGLLGILQNDGPVLWFSQYDSLNDITEGTHVVKVYQYVCKEFLSKKKIDSEFYQAIYDVTPMTKEVFLYNREYKETTDDPSNPMDYCKIEETEKYICCFSKNRDSLPMWNYYSKGDKYEGYNIGFCFWRTKQWDIQDFYGKGYSLDFFTVIYNNEDKQKIIQDKIEELYSFYTKANYDDAKKRILPRIKSILSYFLNALGLKFKQDCFQHEEEVRAILTVPKQNNKFKVEYRNKAGYIIPYIKIPFPAQIVSGITIGPLLNDQSALKNIKQLIRDRHYFLLDDTDIQTSQIPIRY